MGKRKALGILVFLVTLLTLPVFFSPGLAGMVGRLFSGNTGESASTSSTPTVFVDPAKIIDVNLQASKGSKFTVRLNVSSVTNLFAWQVNVTWNPSLFRVNKIIAGDFLSRTTSANKTSSSSRYYGGLGFVINVTDNTKGYVATSESILEDALPGSVPGISGGGALVSIEFLVIGYGSTDLTIKLSGSPLGTTLLDSNGGAITLPPENVVNGYFRNRLPGDIEGAGDKDVDYNDFLAFAASYLKVKGQSGYNREADMELDGDVDYNDFLTFAAYYLKTMS